MSKLVIWSASRCEWVSYPDDEIIWLDRTLLSDGQDQSLHRIPRCPALRFVHHRWEVFSRDITHEVYIASFTSGDHFDWQAVMKAARYVLPKARLGLEPQPARLDGGNWVIGVGKWVLPVCVDVATEPRLNVTTPRDDSLPVTSGVELADVQDSLSEAAEAIAQVRRYFERNPMGCLAMAYYYRDYIRGELAPQLVPMLEVVVALDLSNEGAVSEYKKELQRRVWNEAGHQRELGRFLLANHLIGMPELNRALLLAAENEASGRTKLARERLRYKTKRAT